MSNGIRPNPPTADERRAWLATLARAPAAALEQLLAQCAPLPDYQLPRPPQTGLCMVRGRMGGAGRAFNLGEMTVTRCVVQLDDALPGIAYVMGRNRRRAELAALADALLVNGRLPSPAVDPLRAAQQAARRDRGEAVASTRVDFFTLVRGEG